MQYRMSVASEGFLKRSEIEFVRPGAARLAVQRPVGFSNLVRRKQPVFALGRNEVRKPALGILATDDAVDDHMGDVNPLRAELSRKALGDGAQGSLGRGKGEKVGSRTQRGGGAGIKNGAAPFGNMRRTASRPTRKPPSAFCRHMVSNCASLISSDGIMALLPTL